MHDSLVRLWSTDDLSHAEFCRAWHVSFAFPPHFHGTVCLGLIVRGALQLTLGRARETVGKGGFILINAGEVHAGHAATAEGYVMRTLHVAPADLARPLGERGLKLGADLSLRSGVSHDPALAQLFFGIHACAETNDDRLKRDASLERLISHLAGRAAPALPGADARMARRFRDYIEARLFEPVRLAELARIADMPAYAVVRTFKRRFGVPPHRYQTQRRIDAARRLIRDGVPLGELSHLCGFADQAHFTRAFKQTLGFTPGFYARRLSA